MPRKEAIAQRLYRMAAVVVSVRPDKAPGKGAKVADQMAASVPWLILLPWELIILHIQEGLAVAAARAGMELWAVVAIRPGIRVQAADSAAAVELAVARMARSSLAVMAGLAVSVAAAALEELILHLTAKFMAKWVPVASVAGPRRRWAVEVVVPAWAVRSSAPMGQSPS